ncbi:MAG: hypothetical protein IPP82_00945 [Xanthomonadales bacterium]|nr:hypothetical protein [Xanthomonadales bacterium]
MPSSIDLRATLGFIDMVRKRDEVRSGRMRLAMIANRVRERTLSLRQLDATLGRVTSAAMIRIRDSQTYVGLAEHGQSVFDLDSKAILAHRADWTPLLNWLNWHADSLRDRAKGRYATGRRQRDPALAPPVDRGSRQPAIHCEFGWRLFCSPAFLPAAAGDSRTACNGGIAAAISSSEYTNP